MPLSWKQLLYLEKEMEIYSFLLMSANQVDWTMAFVFFPSVPRQNQHIPAISLKWFYFLCFSLFSSDWWLLRRFLPWIHCVHVLLFLAFQLVSLLGIFCFMLLILNGFFFFFFFLFFILTGESVTSHLSPYLGRWQVFFNPQLLFPPALCSEHDTVCLLKRELHLVEILSHSLK